MAVNVAPGATALRPVSCIWPAVPVHWTGPEYVPDGPPPGPSPLQLVQSGHLDSMLFRVPFSG